MDGMEHPHPQEKACHLRQRTPVSGATDWPPRPFGLEHILQLATAQPSGTPSGNIYTRQTINLGFGKDLVLMLYALSFSQRKTLNFQL